MRKLTPLRFAVRRPGVEHRRARLLPDWVRRADAVAARRINEWPAHPRLDTGFAGLSRAADRGRLWFAIAGVLALAGRRRADLRGAALRGSGSLVAASILANLVGKRLFGGPRPLLSGVPIGRRLAKYPTSASFPSGHSASAAGFAVGVTIEAPAAAIVVAPLAAAVAYSRLHVSAHWLSDVVGGVVLGAVVAVVGRALVPARP